MKIGYENKLYKYFFILICEEIDLIVLYFFLKFKYYLNFLWVRYDRVFLNPLRLISHIIGIRKKIKIQFSF